jgi:purine-binding chemotaxis protein CheW
MKNPQQQKVADPDIAIDDYLQALLKDVDDYDPAIETKQEIVVEAPQIVETPSVVEIANTTNVQVVEEDQVAEIVPTWAEASFQCLMFKVNGITLSIPLSSLQTIIEWKQKPSVIPGQPYWHLGIMMNREDKVGIIDTAKIIMPERLSDRADGERQTGGYIIVVGDGRWGLACDSIVSTELFTQEMIRWRTGLGKRPWLAGTAKDQLCAVLDVEALLGMLAT